MTSPYTYHANLLDENQAIAPDSIVSKTVYKDKQMTVIQFTFAAGQELSEHTSTKVATMHFLQGEADITLGEEALTAQAGTWVRMEPNLPHSILAKTPVIMLLTMMKSE